MYEQMDCSINILGREEGLVAKLTLSTNWILYSFINHMGTYDLTTITLPKKILLCYQSEGFFLTKKVTYSTA